MKCSQKFTFAKMLSRSWSAVSSQNVANSVKSCRVGGVVISKNLVKSVRREHAGNFSCGSQLFETPILKESFMFFLFQIEQWSPSNFIHHIHILSLPLVV